MNGTGPQGEGPKTGRALGKCSNESEQKPFDGRGRGAGRGRGFSLGQEAKIEANKDKA